MKDKRGVLSHLYEHLITKKKYNTLQLKYDVKMDEFLRLEIRYNEMKKLYETRQEIWEQKLKEQEEEIIKLKKKKIKKESEK